VARRVVYWDSAAFLGLINKDKTDYQNSMCEAVWKAGKNGDIHIVTSALAAAEVIYLKGVPKLDPNKRVLVGNFFRQQHLSQKSVTRMIAELARDVVWDSAIKPKDAIHVATAALYKITEFHTYDGGLLDLKQVLVNGFTINICEPYQPHQASLIEDDPEEAN
jgi:predicted nucleic acid-binding protein